MGALVLACGPGSPGPPAASGAPVLRVPARPGKADLAPALAGDEVDRIVVSGTDADLAAVVLRLLRTERLASTVVGFVPARNSAVARRWGLPRKPSAGYRLALDGAPRAVPLIRDDAGGVLVGSGVLAPVRAVAYCDDTLVLRASARRLDVSPGEPESPGLVVRVSTGVLPRRRRAYQGRALQLGLDPEAPARPILDGVTHPRSIRRWSWYRHTEDLRLVRS